MKNKLDNFLLGTLWLSATTLGACFWFNTRFGFNLFSASHWKHLAYMQAAQNPVSPAFYISMIIAVIVAILGLYLLIRPHFRKIRLPIRHVSSTAPTTTQTVISQPPTTSQPVPAAPATASLTTPAPAPIPEMARPPRLNVAITPTLVGTPPQTQPQSTTIPTPTVQSAPQTDWPQLREIFINTGYTVKTAPRIGTTQTALLAIGTDETLWLGGVGIEKSALQNAINTMNQVFSDTLDDIYINVHGFVIAAPDAGTTSESDILTFDSINALQTYMASHPNPPLPADDSGNFDAFSAYISTVIDYLGKI